MNNAAFHKFYIFVEIENIPPVLFMLFRLFKTMLWINVLSDEIINFTFNSQGCLGKCFLFLYCFVTKWMRPHHLSNLHLIYFLSYLPFICLACQAFLSIAQTTLRSFVCFVVLCLFVFSTCIIFTSVFLV